MNEPVLIHSEGSYLNYVCGTGWAYDSGGTTTTVRFSDGSVVSDIRYEVKFAAGSGKLQIGGSSKNPHTDLFDQPVGGNWTGVGTIHMTPASTGACVIEPVDQFEVSAGFTAVRP